MSAPLLPTAYLPPVAYMACLAQNTDVTVEVYETYPKQTLRNRAIIMTANGLQDLTVPVSRPDGNHTITSRMAVDNSRPWARTHLRTLDAAYSASPYYFYYRDDIERTLLTPYPTLIELNTALTELLLRLFKIECKIVQSTDFEPPCGKSGDLRQAFGPKHARVAIECLPYTQVFADRHRFEPNLSAIDLLCCLGPDSKDYLQSVKLTVQDT